MPIIPTVSSDVTIFFFLPSASTHGFINARSTLGMPSLDIAAELLAGVEDTVVVILVMKGTSNRVSEHALRYRWKALCFVCLEESRGMGGGSFGCGMVSWSTELVELIFRYKMVSDGLRHLYEM